MLDAILEDIGPRLARLRTAASERFDEYTRLQDFEAMRTGRLPFPDERLPSTPDAVALTPDASVDVPRLDAPNARAGAELVAKHGGVEAAMRAYAPDSREFDDIQAYRYVTSTKRPKGWLPPIV